MAKDYARTVGINRSEVERDIILMAAVDRVHDVRRTAIQTLVRYNSLLPTSLTEAQLNNAVPNLVNLLTVAVPATPANLSSLTDAELVALAEAHVLAKWDYEVRIDQAFQVEQFYTKLGFPSGTTAVAGISAMRASLINFCNYVRAARGLPALT